MESGRIFFNMPITDALCLCDDARQKPSASCGLCGGEMKALRGLSLNSYACGIRVCFCAWYSKVGMSVSFSCTFNRFGFFSKGWQIYAFFQLAKEKTPFLRFTLSLLVIEIDYQSNRNQFEVQIFLIIP